MQRGAIFDMDGLMFDTEAMYQEVWNEIAAEMGFTLPQQFVFDVSGTSGELLKSVVSRYYHTDDPVSLFQRVVGTVEERLKTQVPVKPGLFEILEYFHEHNVKLAVASSSYPGIIQSNLRVSGTEQYFDEIISGSWVEKGKPEPDIFLLAASKLGLDPKDCYVFEDSNNGVMAGLAAGCTTVMIPDVVPPKEKIRNSDAVILSSLHEALDEIRTGKL